MRTPPRAGAADAVLTEQVTASVPPPADHTYQVCILCPLLGCGRRECRPAVPIAVGGGSR